MPVKLNKQPFCRRCGKPIGKYTTTVYCKGFGFKSTYSRNIEATLYSKADCQRHTNQHVVSVSYGTAASLGDPVHHFSEWDGESYVDAFFDSGACAKLFAYDIVTSKPCMATDKWRNAMMRAYGTFP